MSAGLSLEKYWSVLVVRLEEKDELYAMEAGFVGVFDFENGWIDRFEDIWDGVLEKSDVMDDGLLDCREDADSRELKSCELSNDTAMIRFEKYRSEELTLCYGFFRKCQGSTDR